MVGDSCRPTIARGDPLGVCRKRKRLNTKKDEMVSPMTVVFGRHIKKKYEHQTALRYNSDRSPFTMHRKERVGIHLSGTQNSERPPVQRVLSNDSPLSAHTRIRTCTRFISGPTSGRAVSGKGALNANC